MGLQRSPSMQMGFYYLCLSRKEILNELLQLLWVSFWPHHGIKCPKISILIKIPLIMIIHWAEFHVMSTDTSNITFELRQTVFTSLTGGSMLTYVFPRDWCQLLEACFGISSNVGMYMLKPFRYHKSLGAGELTAGHDFVLLLLLSWMPLLQTRSKK